VIINGITPLAVVIKVLLGIVTTLAGSGQSFVDGTGTAARFNLPRGVAVIPSTNVIVVADEVNNRIRLITYPGGVVTTLAGQTTAGSADGTGAGASFSFPIGVALLSDGNIVVTDGDNGRIRIVNPTSGAVTTLATGFSEPHGVAVIPSTNVIVVADHNNHRIRLVTYPDGVVTTLAGSTAGFLDGTGTAAQFNYPLAVAIDAKGNIIVSEEIGNRIRLITYPGGVVTTLAGNGSSGFANGTGTGASFSLPGGLAVTSTGDIVVGDTNNNRIRLIT
jgi:hypothetical protein